jgi:protein phosphatase
MNLAVQVVGDTDVGCVRANNEDCFGYDRQRGIFVVCDGMGGEAAGEVASQMAVDAVLGYFRQARRHQGHSGDGPRFEGVSRRANALANAIQLANRTIYEAAAEDSRRTGMGSTISAVLIEGSLYSIAHVGDSRIYLLRDGRIQQLTHDHSLIMEQVRRGFITAEEAQHSQMQNIIVRALGVEETVEPDLADLVAEAGDTLLLTSDGLTRHVPDDEILKIVQTAAVLQTACEVLIEAARQAGGEDNITCLLLRFVRRSWVRSVFQPH